MSPVEVSGEHEGEDETALSRSTFDGQNPGAEHYTIAPEAGLSVRLCEGTRCLLYVPRRLLVG